jgi:hypothetical protein
MELVLVQTISSSAARPGQLQATLPDVVRTEERRFHAGVALSRAARRTRAAPRQPIPAEMREAGGGPMQANGSIMIVHQPPKATLL